MKVIITCASKFEETDLPIKFVKIFNAHLEEVVFRTQTGLNNKIQVYVAEVETLSELVEKADDCGKDLYININSKRDYGFILTEVTIVDGHL